MSLHSKPSHFKQKGTMTEHLLGNSINLFEHQQNKTDARFGGKKKSIQNVPQTQTAHQHVAEVYAGAAVWTTS